MAKTMQIWEYRTSGPIEKILNPNNSAPYPTRPLKQGQVLVEVTAAGLNPVDYKLPQSAVLSRMMLKMPKAPGLDFSGRVVAAGEGAKARPGDRVLGRLDLEAQGTLAQFVVAGRESYAVLAPAVDIEQAAGVGTAGLTAYQSLVPYVKAGDRVFINGGSSGTGTFGIQIAKAVLGCHVTVTCSGRNADLCRSLGADEVIDYTAGDVVQALKGKMAEAGRPFDHFVDNVGGDSAVPLIRAAENFLVPGGRIIVVGAPSLASGLQITKAKALPRFLGGVGRPITMLMTKNSVEQLEKFAGWLAEGKVRTVLDTVFEWEQAREAYAQLKKGRTAGKIVVRVGGK